MAKPTYCEVAVSNPPSHTLAGYEIVSEKRANGSGVILFLKRVDASSEPASLPSPKKRAGRKAKSAAAPAQPGSQTAFPGGETANG